MAQRHTEFTGEQDVNVCFLEPTAGVLGLSTYAAHNILEPLGIEMLAAYVEEHGFPSTVVQQRCLSREDTIKKLVDACPQVLAITTLTYNIDDALWFAGAMKERVPGVTIILGGYHATAVPDVVLKPEIDYVVVGEGELPLIGLLTALQSGEDTSCIPGVGMDRDGALHLPKGSPTIHALADLPPAKRSPEILRQCKMHGLMYPPPSHQRGVATVLASRGCSHSCAFCSSTLIWKGQVRMRPPRAVADELASLHEQYDVNAVFFCDLTFNASKRYTIELCEEIGTRDLPVHFYAMCTLAGMDDEVAQAMKNAKCEKIGFGVESFNPETRQGMKDGGGMGLEETNAVMDVVTNAGILSKAYFIIGFPWETRDSLSRLSQQLRALRADEIKVTFYVPFPGTRGFAQHHSLLVTHDWRRFTTLTEPIVRNDHLSAEEIKDFRLLMFKSFYAGPIWSRRRESRAASSPEHRQAFDEFTQFLTERRILCKPL
jgi:radical SAM superfamily enzyme YgiQ (UPF0313 family)